MAGEFELTFKDKNLGSFLRNTKKKFDLNKPELRTLTARFKVIVFKDIIDHFKTKKGSGGSWKKWSQRYRKSQVARGRTFLVNALEDSGTLKQAISPIASGKNIRLKQKAILWFNPISYARQHDEGDSKKKIPQREFMWLSSNAMKEIEKTTLDFLTGG